MKSEAELSAAQQTVSAYIAAGCAYKPLSQPSKEACAMFLYTLQWVRGVGDSNPAADLLAAMTEKLRARAVAS